LITRIVFDEEYLQHKGIVRKQQIM
jgi:hypothetical protein